MFELHLPQLVVKKSIVMPKLVVPERVVLQMVEETLSHPPTETGQALIGLEPSEDLIIILGIIPDVEDTLRQPGLFSLGGDDQVEIFRWFNRHWEAMRKSSKEVQLPSWQFGQLIPKGFVPQELNFPLKRVGEWHRHPGDYKELSPQDRGQILSILMDPSQNRHQFVAPIVIYKPDARFTWTLGGQELVIQQFMSEIRVNWYYARRGNPFRVHHLTPIIVPDNQLPWMPPIAWHLININRMRTELALLKQAGYLTRWTVKEIEGDSQIQEVVFGIDHPTWRKRILVITQWDYPKSRPSIKLIDKAETEAEAEPDASDEPHQKKSRVLNRLAVWWRGILRRPDFNTKGLRYPTSQWEKSVYLVDLVKRIEPQVKGAETDEQLVASGIKSASEPGSGDATDRPEGA